MEASMRKLTKLTSPSTKACKKERRSNGKLTSSTTTSTNCMSLMNILRPKVYITDASSFKSLVQELTGNYDPPPAVAATSASSSFIPHLTEAQEYTGDDVTGGHFSCYSAGGNNDEVVVNIAGDGEGNYDDGGMDLLTYKLLESWLLDTNHHNNNNDIVSN